eukprot:12910201-Heterocapsa_arctica.AAC.1
MHRKCCMSVFGRSYRFIEDLPERRAVRLPADIADELVSAALHLSVVRSDIRAPVSSRVSCSDATPQTAGTVECQTLQACAEALYDRAEHKGAYTRMDWHPGHFSL